jgi:hypothetical protein
MLARIFGPLMRWSGHEGTFERAGGLGLGLYIAREIVKVVRTVIYVRTKLRTRRRTTIRRMQFERIAVMLLGSFGFICGLIARKSFRNPPGTKEPMPCVTWLAADSIVPKPREQMRGKFGEITSSTFVVLLVTPFAMNVGHPISRDADASQCVTQRYPRETVTDLRPQSIW